MIMRVIVLLALTLVVTAAMAAPPKPRLTADQAIRLATAAAKKEHIDLKALLPPTAKYYANDRHWFISWDERPDKSGLVTVGGDYSAHVDDTTGKVRLIPGR